MGLVSGLAVYFIIWWLVFFAVLPFGVRTQAEDESTVAGSTPSAPSRPLLLRKALITSAIAALLFAALYWLIVVAGVGLDDIPFLPDPTPEGWRPTYERVPSQ